MRVLITGGCGFIGHHVVEHIIKNTDWDIVVLDKLNYASEGFDRLRDIGVFDDKRVHILSADFILKLSEGIKREIGDVNYILHLGAESHVDNSITDPEPFVMSNVVGTMRVLDFSREQKSLKWFVYFSTDEVFGSAPEGVSYKEWDRYNSTNPYSAAKAGGEELCLAYANTYKLPLFITHTMNNFGERQHPEKFIPMCIRKILNGEEIEIHTNKEKTKAGSRFYIHARSVASAVLFLLKNAEQREKYNIVGDVEIDNYAMACNIGKILGKPAKCKMVDFHSARPGHDLRYALDGTKMKSMGWNPKRNFYESLKKTVEWSIDKKNKRWITMSGGDSG